MKLILLLAVTLSLVSVVGCAAGEADPDTVAQVRLGIGLINSELQEAYRAGDPERVATLFAEDVILMPNKAPSLHGSDAVRSLLTNFFGNTTVTTYDLTTDELHVYGETAYEWGTFQWRSVVSEQDTIVEQGRYSAVRKRSPDGRWLIHRLIENTMPTGHPDTNSPGG
jgi:uncharacterized protein (TIGR02246 family)